MSVVCYCSVRGPDKLIDVKRKRKRGKDRKESGWGKDKVITGTTGYFECN